MPLYSGRVILPSVKSAEVDAYLSGLEEPKRATLQELRRTILELLPDAVEGISYGMPAYKVKGKKVAGFAAFKNHLSYLPHSGSVLSKLADELATYEQTKGSLHFPAEHPLPRHLVRRLLSARLAEAGIPITMR